MKPWLLVTLWFIVAGLIAACGAGSVQPEAAQAQSEVVDVFTTQSNSEGAVTVEVTPLNLPGNGDTLDFEVTFNTHSVDLSFDPMAISRLRDSTGREYPAITWEGDDPGGHHRSGVLHFNAPDRATPFVEVVMHEIAGVPERIFRWNLTQN